MMANLGNFLARTNQMLPPPPSPVPVQQGHRPKTDIPETFVNGSGSNGDLTQRTSDAHSTDPSKGVDFAAKSTGSSDTPVRLTENSAGWVSYHHGINLAEAIEPGSSKRMTIDELIALPAKMSEEAVTEEQELFLASTRVGPTLEWAVANGIIPKKKDYNQEDIYAAATALEKYQDKLAAALTSLTTPVPMRKNYYIGTQLVSPIRGHSDPDNKKYPVAIYEDQRFIDDFKADLKDKKEAYATIIGQLLSTIPLAGEVTFYSLQPPGTTGDPDRSTFLIKTERDGKQVYYEVNPGLGIAQERPELKDVFNGRSVIGQKQLRDGTFSDEYFVWEKPNIQSNRYRPKVELRGKAVSDYSVFSAKIYTPEVLEHFPSLDAHSSDMSTSLQAQLSRRRHEIANGLSDNFFYVNELDLLHMAKEDPDRVTQAEKDDREDYQTFREDRDKRREFLKGLVPIWRSIEAFVKGQPIEGAGLILIDILSFALPIGKVASGLVKVGVKGAQVVFKAALSKFSTLVKKVIGFNSKAGVQGIKWVGGVPGIKWGEAAAGHAVKGLEQFKVNSSALLKSTAGIREIELNGSKYFAAGKPDAGDGVHYLLRVPDPKDPSKLISSGKIAKPDDVGIWSRRGETGGGKSDSQPSSRSGSRVEGDPVVTLSEGKGSFSAEAATPKGAPIAIKKTMQELQKLDDGVFIFTDYTKGGQKRLNILSHGKTLGTHGGDTKLAAANLRKKLIEKGIDLESYDRERILACYSGSNDTKSFITHYQKLTNKPVKGYDGVVTTSMTPESIQKDFDTAVAIYGDEHKAAQAVAENYAHNKIFTQSKERSFSPFSRPFKYWLFRYKPITVGG